MRFPGGRRERRARSLHQRAVRRRALLVRHQPSWRAGAAQLPDRAAQAADEGRPLPRYRLDRRVARPRAWRAALLRVPPPSRHARAEDFRAAHIQRRMAARARRGLQIGRAGRPPGRHALRDRASRPGFPILRSASASTGVAPPQNDRFFTSDFTRRSYPAVSPGCATQHALGAGARACATLRQYSQRVLSGTNEREAGDGPSLRIPV